jgi:hypothetical protein
LVCFYPVDALQIAVFHPRSLLEIEKRRAFEREHRKRAFEHIAERVLAIACAFVGNGAELLAQALHERIEVQSCGVF